MIIHHRKRFVFVHVPRTGGHSGYAMLGRPSKGGTHRDRESAPPDFWSFGFVRNPWARMVSCYLHQRDLGRELHPEAAAGFEAYLENNRVNRSAAELLAGCDHVARFENFEQEWLKILGRLKLQPPAKGVPKKNARPPYDYRAFYSGRTAQVVAERWSDDVVLGGYSF